jgi:choline dehydrogenase-like flavoprotein
MLQQALLYKLDISRDTKHSELFLVSEQTPYKDSCIKSTKKLSTKPRVNWRLRKIDFDNATLFDKLLSSFLISLGFKKHNSDNLKLLGSAAHHCGSARMGKSIKDSVCNKNLKIHQFNNLYICDSSVFTTSGSANNTLTCVALAIRLAKHLNNEI